MTLEDLKESKADLELDILKLIRYFETNSGASVCGINLTQSRTVDSFLSTTIAVNIEVKL